MNNSLTQKFHIIPTHVMTHADSRCFCKFVDANCSYYLLDHAYIIITEIKPDGGR